MGLTTDPNDPRLGKGINKERVPQNEVYLILSDEELSKGFTRPVRYAYIHKGKKIYSTIKILSEEKKEKFKKYGWIAFSPNDDKTSDSKGIYLTQEDLNTHIGQYVGGCNTETTMGKALSETYARDPSFYGATYCCHCQKHLPVQEFVWKDDGTIVGS